MLVDYMNYREVEAKLNDMEAKYEALLKERGKDDAPSQFLTKWQKASEKPAGNPTGNP